MIMVCWSVRQSCSFTIGFVGLFLCRGLLYLTGVSGVRSPEVVEEARVVQSWRSDKPFGVNSTQRPMMASSTLGVFLECPECH